jgi:hypothetical protein
MAVLEDGEVKVWNLSRFELLVETHLKYILRSAQLSRYWNIVYRNIFHPLLIQPLISSVVISLVANYDCTGIFPLTEYFVLEYSF